MKTFSLLTVVFAFCSIVYQLFIAQTLTSTLGGTNFRYALTIGLYITSMGIAALFSHRVSKGSPKKVLVKVELLLIAAGLCCVPFVLLCENARILAISSIEPSALLSVLTSLTAWVAHAPIIVVGVLSGLELPLLMECASAAKNEEPRFQFNILAFDYMGTMIGALVFPFFLLPEFGVTGVAFFTALLNAFTLAALLAVPSEIKTQSRQMVATGFVVVLALALFLNRDVIHQMVIQKLYFSV